jgi:hypothetical protein
MKTVVVDMDGVICEERPTFERSLAKPLRDARDRIAAMRDDGHRIIIHTARSWSELAMTEEWLYEHGIVYDQLVMGKPVADVVVDDRAVTSLEEAESVTAGDTSKKPVAESPKQLREPVAWRVQALEAENNRLRDAIRRLADQDATLSVCDGDVTVTMDAMLTDEEREAIALAKSRLGTSDGDWQADDVLAALLKRLG